LLQRGGLSAVAAPSRYPVPAYGISRQPSFLLFNSVTGPLGLTRSFFPRSGCVFCTVSFCPPPMFGFSPLFFLPLFSHPFFASFLEPARSPAGLPPLLPIISRRSSPPLVCPLILAITTSLARPVVACLHSYFPIFFAYEREFTVFSPFCFIELAILPPPLYL